MSKTLDPTHRYPSLYKYFQMATHTQDLFMEIANANMDRDVGDWTFDPRSETFLALSYASLYVVIEGWRAEKINHTPVTELLRNDRCVKLLREFRNSVFHYSCHYEDERAAKAREDNELTDWIYNLHYAIGRFFAGI